MTPGPDGNTAAVLVTPVVLFVTTQAEEGYMPYNVACRYLFTTDFNSSFFCAFHVLATRTGTLP